MSKQCKNCRFWRKYGITKSGGKMICNFNDNIPNHIPKSQKQRYINNYAEKAQEFQACNLFLPKEDNAKLNQFQF